MNDSLKVLGFKHELQIVDLATGKLIHREAKYNRIPQAGLDFLMLSPFGDMPSIGSFYCGLYRNNFLADNNTTAADIPSNMGEFVAYSETSRPLWNRDYSPGTLDNFASKAVFTPTQDATIYGSFLCSNQAKGSGSGLLLSVVRFNTVKTLTAGQEATLVCGLTYIPTTTI